MTPAEVDALLPNGFHDAVLRELHVDFDRAEARLTFDFLTGVPDAETEEERESMRPGYVHLSGLASLSVEPVDARYDVTDGRGMNVDGGFEGALTVWLSTRHCFREGDEGWASYQAFICLPQLREVTTIDSSLNLYVDRCGSFQISAFEDVTGVIRTLPRPASDRCYYLLHLDAENEARPPEGQAYRLLGHDLSDVDRVREKCVEKSYVTPYAMELLVYGDDLVLPYDVWLPKFEKDLKDLLDGSTFRRLWVVNLTPRESSRRVWLVHPPRPPTGR